MVSLFIRFIRSTLLNPANNTCLSHSWHSSAIHQGFGYNKCPWGYPVSLPPHKKRFLKVEYQLVIYQLILNLKALKHNTILNGITLGQGQTDCFNQLITISKWTRYKHYICKKVIKDLLICFNLVDPINSDTF